MRGARQWLGIVGTSLLGWVTSCGVDPLPPYGEVVCVDGGAMVLGNRSLVFADYIQAAPERIVAVSRFGIDASEVSVGDFRAALERGFSPPLLPVTNDGPLTDGALGACTFTSGVSDREGYAINCVPWETVRAYCQDRGGDLPTEAQWEMVATLEGREGKTSFPWGQREPSRDEVVFGRLALSGFPGSCETLGTGPVALGTGDDLDVSPSGVRGLAGGMSEWTRDGGKNYDHPCWAAAVVDPWCAPLDDDRSVRGGAWASPKSSLVGTYRMSRPAGAGIRFVGFRCVYEVQP